MSWRDIFCQPTIFSLLFFLLELISSLANVVSFVAGEANFSIKTFEWNFHNLCFNRILRILLKYECFYLETKYSFENWIGNTSNRPNNEFYNNVELFDSNVCISTGCPKMVIQYWFWDSGLIILRLCKIRICLSQIYIF